MIGDFAQNTTVFTDPRVTGATTSHHREFREYLAREWRFRGLSLRGMLRFCLSLGKG